MAEGVSGPRPPHWPPHVARTHTRNITESVDGKGVVADIRCDGRCGVVLCWGVAGQGLCAGGGMGYE